MKKNLEKYLMRTEVFLLINYTLSPDYNWRHLRIANYSFNNIMNAEDIQKALEQVFRSSTRAFRFTIYFDSIWESMNIEE